MVIPRTYFNVCRLSGLFNKALSLILHSFYLKRSKIQILHKEYYITFAVTFYTFMITPDLSFESVLFIFFTVMFAIQMWFYCRVFSKIAFLKNKDKPLYSEPVTIIICAKNEAENLRKNLPLVLEQNYPSFDVIVVNDCSTDETPDVLKDFEKKYKHLRTITIKQEGHSLLGKKYPLTLGIKGAQNELLLLTDADCYPKSGKWLEKMIRNFSGEKDIVLGYGAYEKLPGFLNKLIRFDAFYIALQYFSFALIGKPYMGVGRNLAYRNSLFFKNKGFAKQNHILSGDDDLFINRVANRINTAIELDKESHTVSKAKTTFTEWFHQKRRHISTSKHYKRVTKQMLGALTLSSFFFILSFLLLVIMNYALYLILSMFLLRLTIQFIIFKKSMQRLDEKDLLLFSPLMEIIMMFLYPALAIYNILIKGNKWK